MREVTAIILALACGMSLSCSEKDDSVINPTSLPPFLGDATVNPDAVNTDTLQSGTAGSTTVSLVATASISDPNGRDDITSTVYRVKKPSQSTAFSSGTLRDDGRPPDAMASDGVYSGPITFDIDRNDIGNYTVELFATDRSGLSSNAALRTVTIFRKQNSPPVISNLAAPDTVTLPTSGAVLFDMSIDASDPDGPSDISKVFFQSLDSPGDPTFMFLMFDDGNTQSDGDLVSGDGTYSVRVQLPASTLPDSVAQKAFRFQFQALDKPGAASNTILHTLNVVK